jgi:hypothetical protein
MALIAKEADAGEEWGVKRGVARSHDCEVHAPLLIPHPMDVRPTSPSGRRVQTPAFGIRLR